MARNEQPETMNYPLPPLPHSSLPDFASASMENMDIDSQDCSSQTMQSLPAHDEITEEQNCSSQTMQSLPACDEKAEEQNCSSQTMQSLPAHDEITEEHKEMFSFIHKVKEKKKMINNFFDYSDSKFMTDLCDVAIINEKIKRENRISLRNVTHPTTPEGRLAKAKEKKVLDRLCESVMHAANCKLTNCKVIDCTRRQHFILSISLCEVEGWCDKPMCQQFTVLLRHHVKNCERYHCPFPTCSWLNVEVNKPGSSRMSRKEDCSPIDLFLFQRKMLANYKALRFCVKCEEWKCTVPPNVFSCNCGR